MLPLSRREYLASIVSVASGGLRPPHAFGAELLAPFDRLLTQFITEHKLPGAALAVTRNGKLVCACGFGFADVEQKRAVRPDSLFRVASVSKPITAVAVMMLAEQRKLELDAPVLRYIKFAPAASGDDRPDPRWEKVTVRHCLQHTGGWDRDREGGFDPIAVPGRVRRALGLTGPPAPLDVVRYMMGRRLDFDPGTRFAYSNLGYLLLGRVIEAVTGEKYEPWVRKHVLAPVGAGGMSLARAIPENRPEREVRYYDSKQRKGACLYPPRAGERVPLPDGAQNVEAYEAHGGWVASAVDLVRFACAFDYGRVSPLLSARTIQEMWARPPGAVGRDTKGKSAPAYYGCGWNVRPAGKSGRANTWHDGLISGTSTLLVRRHDGLNWAVLFNTDANPDGKHPASLIDGPMHEAAAAVKQWPETDLFGEFKGVALNLVSRAPKGSALRARLRLAANIPPAHIFRNNHSARASCE